MAELREQEAQRLQRDQRAAARALAEAAARAPGAEIEAQGINADPAEAGLALATTIKLLGMVQHLSVPSDKEGIFSFITEYKTILHLAPNYRHEQQEGFSVILRAILARFLNQGGREGLNSMTSAAQIEVDVLGGDIHLIQLTPILLEELLLHAALVQLSCTSPARVVIRLTSVSISSISSFKASWLNVLCHGAC